jgi:hypothetical protein
MDDLGFLFLSRNWKEDKAQIIYSARKYAAEYVPFCVVLFPEVILFTMQQE